ncbi:MAG: DUF255 domain-containing protein [Hyphomicrobiaceae bacterium]|nr:DUF255 domain-containing protein [Hyphomicrobiaceae bacterium]
MRHIIRLSFRNLCAALAALLFTSSLANAQDGSGAAPAPPKEPPQITWHAWGDALFETAKRENRHILLDLNARWCHWCHFMERRTYAHPDVRELVARGYLAVRVDQDANPDLASRYGDWGWPATIIFDPQGNEVAKLQGFQRPSLMSMILYVVRNQPEQIPKLPTERAFAKSATAFLDEAQRTRILDLMDKSYDTEHAGWGRRLKFLRPDMVEFALRAARRGDKIMEQRVRASLDAAIALVDLEWGGIYQYSHKRDWSAPHFEKLMWSQAQNMRLYALAYKQLGDEKYLDVAQSLYGYLTTYLRGPQGAFYTSQDADVDAETLGEDFYKLSAVERARQPKSPPIDKNRYARENGWAISGLLAVYDVTGDQAVREHAIRAAEWVLANRALPGGGFSHGDNDRGGPFLSDALAMARGLLDLYAATGDVRWLREAEKTGDFMKAMFAHAAAGFMTTAKPAAGAAAFAKPYFNIEENIRLARFSNIIHRVSGKARFREMAVHAMRYLTTDEVTKERRFLVGIVLADEELAVEPAQITVVGAKTDDRAKRLHRAALKLAFSYRHIDWWDPAKEALPNPDVTYPPLDRPAAFACANQICSLPVFEPEGLAPVVQRMLQQRVVRRAEN